MVIVRTCRLEVGHVVCIRKGRLCVCKLEVVGVMNFSGQTATCSHMFMSLVHVKRLPFSAGLM